MKGLNFDEIYGKHLKVTDNNGDPSKPGFSLVTPLNGDSWNWRERPEFKDLVKQKLNDPGFLGDHKYQQIIDAMSGKPFDPTKHIAKGKQNMKNEEVVTEGDARLARLSGAMDRLTARKTGRLQSGNVQDTASQSISGSLGARSANAADKPGLAGALQRAQKQNIIRDSGLNNATGMGYVAGRRRWTTLGAHSIVANHAVDKLRQGYTIGGLQASTGGQTHRVALAGGPLKGMERTSGVGSDVSDQVALGGHTGTLATRQRDKKEIQKNKQANSVNLFRGREIVTDEFHGNNMKNEEVKIDKQRNGRPFPEIRFPGWKVGNNMLTQKRATKRPTKRPLPPAQKANGLKNEEYTQVLEQMIVSLTGIELEDLHEAVSNQLSEDTQTDARMRQLNKRARSSGDPSADILGKSERKSRTVFGLGGKKLAPSSSAYFKKYPRALGLNDKRVDDL